VQINNPAARVVWAGITPVHVQVVRRLLEQASSRERNWTEAWSANDSALRQQVRHRMSGRQVRRSPSMATPGDSLDTTTTS
jgi:hypothetical protein